MNLAEPPLAHHRHGGQEPVLVLAPLLGADLEDPAGLLHHRAELLPLVDRQGQRLLAVNVLAGPERGDRDRGVPVVGRADRDDVDVVAIEQLAVVFVDVALARADLLVVAGGLGVRAIDVAEGQDVAILLDRPGIPLAHASVANAADPRPLVGRTRLVGHRPPAREPRRQHPPCGRGRRRGPEKVTPRRLALAHVSLPARSWPRQPDSGPYPLTTEYHPASR